MNNNLDLVFIFICLSVTISIIRFLGGILWLKVLVLAAEI